MKIGTLKKRMCEPEKKLNVVFVVDKNYIQHFTVACTSLLENSGATTGRIMLIHDLEKTTLLHTAVKYLSQKYGRVIEQYPFDSRVVCDLKITHHFTKTTYFKLLLADILPEDIDRVLFLDSDIIVAGELSGICSIDFIRDDSRGDERMNQDENGSPSEDRQYYVYAADHKYTGEKLSWLRNTSFQGDRYFNSGVMYVNLKLWRERNISSVFLNNARRYHDHIIWPEQDVLNITLDGAWGELDYEFNTFNLKERSAKHYKVIHYTGSSKPWHLMNKHPYRKLYWEYLKMTPFKRYIPEDFTLINVVKRMTPQKMKKYIRRAFGKSKERFEIEKSK